MVFDAPIGGICGLMFRNLDPWLDDPASEVHTVDCHLVSTGSREITDETFGTR